MGGKDRVSESAETEVAETDVAEDESWLRPFANAPAQAPGMPGAPDAALPPGARLGRYVILEQVGAGGMGVVYAAYDTELDRKLAIKLMHADLATQSSTGELRMLREAQAMARLTHPNVVAVHDVGMFEGGVFLAMDFVDGMTMTAWLKTRRSLRERLALLRSAGRGLAAAHAAGIVHRDFKPENVLVGRDGRVLVTDFGLARAGLSAPDAPAAVQPPSSASGQRMVPARVDLATPLTGAGRIAGTLGYMAPEQARGEEITGAADQFSYAVTLYRALYGELPFPTTSVREYLSAIDGPPPRPAKGDRGERVPSWIRRVVLRGLAAKPAARFPSLDALLEALGKDPAVRLRRAAAGVAVAVAVGSGLLYAHARQLSCQSAGDAVTRVWNPGARAAVVAAFAGKPYLATMSDLVVKRLDSYAAEITSGLVETCRVSVIRNELPADQAEARRDCLLGRLSEVTSVEKRLQNMPAEKLDDAIGLVGGLSAVEDCRDTRRSALTGAMPSDPARREAVRQVRRKLVEGKDKMILGEYDESAKQLRGAVEEAKSADYEPLLAEAELQLASIEVKRAHDAEAESLLRRALFDGDLAHDDIVRAVAATSLIECFTRSGKYDRALEWEPFARAALARAGGDDVREGALENIVGAAYYYLSRYDDSSAAFERSLAIRRRIGETEEIPGLLSNIGAVLHEEGKLREALDKTLDAEKAAAGVLGESHPVFAEFLGNEGSLWLELGRPDKGLQAYERALAMPALTASDPQRFEVLEEKGRGLMDLGQLDEANRVLRGAIVASAVLEQRDATLASLHRALGIDEYDLGHYTQAESDLEEALALYRKLGGDNDPQVARTLLRVASNDLELGRANDAERAADEARRVFEATPHADEGYIARSWSSRADALVALNDRVGAREAYGHALEHLAKVRSERAAEYALASLRVAVLDLPSDANGASARATEAVAGVVDRTDVTAEFVRQYAAFVSGRAGALDGKSPSPEDARSVATTLERLAYVNRTATREAVAP